MKLKLCKNVRTTNLGQNLLDLIKRHVKAFWIGTSRLNNKIKVKNKNIKWAEEKVKALGVWFTLDANKTQMLNYTERREKNNEDYTRLVAPQTYINGQNHRNKEPTSITTGIYP